MKTLKLAFSRIFTYFSENKLIFILYIIGSVTCIFMLIYYYGNILNDKTGSSNDNVSLRLYTVEFVEPVALTAENLESLNNFEQSYEIQDVILTAVLDENGNDDMVFADGKHPAFYYNFPEDGNAMILDTYLNNNRNVMYQPKPNIFTDEQLKQNVAAAPKGKNGSVKIQGQDFQIVKNVSDTNYTIPIEKYFDAKVKTCRIKICISKKFSKNMMFRYGDFLKNLFDEIFPDNTIEVKTPEQFYVLETTDTMIEFALMIATFIAAMISFTFLLKYLMDSAQHENSILMMVGANKLHILLINFTENMILTTFCSFIAISIHRLFYNSLFEKINIYDNIVYYVQDYAVIALIILAISIIVQIPFMLVYWSNHIRKIKEDSK